MNMVLLWLIVYFVVVLSIGLYTKRRGIAETLEGYLLGGRRIGAPVTALTLQSTSMSGYMFLGAGSISYTTGYWGVWYAAGDIGGGIVNLSIIGRRMRKLSKILGSLTSIEYLEHRYPHPSIRIVAGGISIFFMMLYVFAQFIAGGKGLALVANIPYEYALIIAVAIILIYTVLGGYFAVAWTDFFQGLVMVTGILIILFASISYLGGFTAANQSLARIDPTYLSIWGKDLAYKGKWGIVAGAVLIWSIGYMGWPHVVVRHMAMTKPTTARMAGAYSTLWNLLFVTSPYIVGILAIVAIPTLADPEMAIFEMAYLLLPAILVGFVMAAIMAAIMSTADSLLLQSGSIASRDIYQRFINPKATDKQMVWASRVLVLAIGIIGIIVALVQPPGVFALVVFASGVLGDAFLPAYVCAAYWKKANWPGALASFIGGAITNVVWTTQNLDMPTGLHPFFAGLIVSSILIIIVSLATQKSHPNPPEVLRAVDEAIKVGPIPRSIEKRSAESLHPEARGVSTTLK